MNRDSTQFLLLNIGHFFDHFFTLIFATVAALALSRDWGLGYAELLAYATPGFFAFGLFALPAGWLADRWNREGMMVVFFIGIGLSSIAAGFAQSPLQMGIALFVIGIFGAIYHPVGLAIVTTKWKNIGMRIAVNGVWGNLGVASAALVTGYFIDHGGWRIAFVIPGAVSMAIGVFYAWMFWSEVSAGAAPKKAAAQGAAVNITAGHRALLIRVSAVVFISAAISSIVFQSTTFALPKIFDERLQGIASELARAWREGPGNGSGDVATMVGMFAFAVFAIASLAQLVAGKLLDHYSPRAIFMGAAIIQVVFFGLMPGLNEGIALAVAFGFMLGAFGQIPINDFLIGKTAVGEYRARIYAIRYVVSFSVLAATLPFVAVVYNNWGFDTLFRILALLAALILVAVACLPRTLPSPSLAPAGA